MKSPLMDEISSDAVESDPGSLESLLIWLLVNTLRNLSTPVLSESREIFCRNTQPSY